MKRLNATIAIGTLAHVSQGIAMKSLIKNEEQRHSLDSHLVERASEGTTSRVGSVMNWAVDMALRAQEAGQTNWWGWYTVGIVDATADLVTDAASDIYGWGSGSANGIRSFVSDLIGDADQFIDDAMEDVGTWGGHWEESEFSEIADDLHGWVADIERILTEGIREAADGSIEFVGDVTDGVGEWVTEYAKDMNEVFDGTYCFEEECPPQAQELAQAEFTPDMIAMYALDALMDTEFGQRHAAQAVVGLHSLHQQITSAFDDWF